MTSPPIPFAADTPELARAAIQQKTLARKNRTQRTVRFTLGLALGAVLTGALVHVLTVRQLHGTGWVVFSMGVGALLGTLLTSQLHQVLAACPVCAHSWEIKDPRSAHVSEQMETWDKCPGCGLLVADWALKRAVEGKPRL
jgi:hypothetical protein